MKRILITGATTAKAQQIRREIANAELWFADSQPIPSVLLQSDRYSQLPTVASATFIHEVLKACLRVSADQLIVLRPEEWTVLSAHRSLFEEYGIETVQSFV